MVKVALSWSDVQQALIVGGQRRILGIFAERSERQGTPRNDLWGNDIESSAAELAASKYTGRRWISETKRDLSETPPDLWPDVQVRWAAELPTDQQPRRMRLDEHDKGTDRFVFVTGYCPTFEIHGWLRGVEAMQQQWWKTVAAGRPASFWVPRDALHDIADLIVKD